MKNFLSITVLAIFLAGCGGGTIGGLLPAPKIVKGDLDGTKYTSPNRVFSVVAPVSKDRGEWTYTKIKENSESHPDQKSEFVGFKTPYDSHFYSVEVVTLNKDINNENAKLINKDNIKRTIDSSIKRWGSKVNDLGQGELDCGHSKSTYSVFHQRISSSGLSFDKYFLISQSFSGRYFVIVTSELNYDLRGASPPVEQIKNMKFEKNNNFVCSVEILKK